MKGMALLGLDVGSSGCKAMIFDTDGTQLAYAHLEYPPFENVYETHGDLIWEHVKRVIQDCTSVVHETVTAMSISTFGESFVTVDQDGEVLMNTMLYTDPRGITQCKRLVASLGEEPIMGITGMKPQTMYSLVKMMYIKDNHPAVYDKTFKFLVIGSFCIYRLTGQDVIDYSLASRTMAFDVLHKEWSKVMFEAAGVDQKKMAKPIPSGTLVGKILPEIAKELGLSVDMLVVSGGQDQICAALGAGVVDSAVAIDGTGTVECITPIFDAPKLSKVFLENNYTCVPYMVDGMYATYAYNFTGGAILKWFKNNFAQDDVAYAHTNGQSIYQYMDSHGAQTPTDLIVVPHFAGSATPDMNPFARGAFLGLKFDTDKGTLYRAMIEGVTYEMLYNLEILKENGIEIKELRAVGGGAKSDYWLQIKASVTGKTIVPLDVDEAGIVGTVIMAGVATGVYQNIAEAVRVFVKKRNAFEPIPADREIYQKNYQRYKLARAAIAHLFQEEQT